MTDGKALIERLREWPMREQVQTYDHTFHIAETGSSYTTKRVIPQSPKPVMHEAAAHIEKLEADNARLRERDQAVEALRLFVRLMNDPDYDLGELCEEFCTRAETILASIEGTGHE